MQKPPEPQAPNPNPAWPDANDSPAGAGAAWIALAALYLLIPNLLFLATWLQPWIGWPVAAAAAYGYARLLHRLRGAPRCLPLAKQSLVTVLLLALAWTLLSGAGGFLPQSTDYFKHNFVFHDLALQDWPVVYRSADAFKGFLCYSLGYYLPAAALAHGLGAGAVGPASFAWLAAGMFLFFCWLAAFQPRHPIRTVLVFLFCAGLFFIWIPIEKPTLLETQGFRMRGLDLGPLLRTLGLANNNLDAFTRVHFLPQHAIAGWLGAAILFELTWVRKQPAGALLVWATTLLWSPFTAVALFFIPLLSLRWTSFRAFFERMNLLCGGLLVAVMAIYYGAHQPLGDSGLIWALSPDWRWIPFYLLFAATQVLPTAACVYFIDRRHGILGEWRTLFAGMTLLLLALALARVGYHSDLRMQASGPALLFVSLGAAVCFNSAAFSLRQPLFRAHTFVFLLGASYPLGLPLLNLLTNRTDQSYEARARTLGIRDLSEVRDHRFDYNASAQYLGDRKSFAYEHLLQRER